MDYKTADRLIELRKKNGYSQEELAERLNISRQAVSKWERAESLSDTENLIALARLYNITLDEIINGGKATTESDVTESQKYTVAVPFDRKIVLKIAGISLLCGGIIQLIFAIGTLIVLTTDIIRINQNQGILSIVFFGGFGVASVITSIFLFKTRKKHIERKK